MVVLETSMLIDYLNGYAPVREFLESEYVDQEVKITVLTKYEILRGTKKGSLAKINSFLESFNTLYLDEKSMLSSLSAYEAMKKEGRMASELDILILGISGANGELLLTRDKRLGIGGSKVRVVEI